MAGCASYTLTHYPLICSGPKAHRVILDFVNAPFGTVFQIYFTPVIAGLAPCQTSNSFTGNWQWTWDMDILGAGGSNYTLHVKQHNGLCVTSTIVCTLPTNTFFAKNYNYLPYNVFSVVTPSGCTTSSGIINAIISGGIPANGYYFELWNSNNNIIIQDPPIVYTNSYAFTGVAPGTYTIRVYKQFPPGNPNLPSQATCYSFQVVTVTTKCTLKATDCTTGAVFYFDGAASSALILGKVIRTTFPGYPESCYLITDEDSVITAVLGTYYIFENCDLCITEPCPEITSTITGVDDVCDRLQGSATVVPTNGIPPFSYLWSPGGQTSPTITGLGSGSYSVLITDANGCEGTNSIVINNLPCPESYLITPCDPAIAPFYVQDPVTSPDPNPANYVGNIFSGTIILSGSTEVELQGCFNMTPAFVPGVTGVSISISFYSYGTCLECNPLAYKIARCDDPNIYYFTNTDLLSVVGMVIKNVTLTGCTSATYPCPTLPEQCWTVIQASPGLYPVEVTYDSVVYPDCDCCKPC